MKLFTLSVALLCSFFNTSAEDLRLVDLDPPEAQKYIDGKDQSLKYAPKIETNVPAVRVLGRTPTHVLEDIYLANQYHGQDGLGGYLYGYSVPDIAKTEKKKPDGDLTGAYNYVNGDGQEIKVQYWDRGDGFHQIDNVPKILPKQIDDLPEVKAAKEEHARIWKEEAERNSRPIADPYANYQQPQLPQYQQQQTQYQQTQYQKPLQTQYQQPQPVPSQYQQPQQVPNQYQQPQQVPSQYQKPQLAPSQYQQPQPGQYQPGSNLNNIDYSGQYSANDQSYAENPNKRKEWEYKPTAEEQGPPRGFFYNFDYPVGIIVQKQGDLVQKRESLGPIYAQNRAAYEEQVKSGAGPTGSYQLHA